MRILIFCVLFFTGAMASAERMKDFSCYSQCVSSGRGTPYDCNLECREKKRKLMQQQYRQEQNERHPNDYGGMQTTSQRCYNFCLSHGQDEAECASMCNMQGDRNDGYRQGGGCLQECRDRGYRPEDCLDFCADRGSIDDFIFNGSQGENPMVDPSRVHIPESPIRNENAIPKQNQPFDGTHFGCFKSCRLRGEAFGTCSNLCAE